MNKTSTYCMQVCLPDLYTTGTQLGKSLLLLFFMLALTFSASAQITIFTEDFETNGNTINGGDGRYTSLNDFHDGVTDDDYFGRVRASDEEYFLTNTASGIDADASNNYIGQSGDFFYAAEDLDDTGGSIGSPNGSTFKDLSITGINITGGTNLAFKGLFARGETDGCGTSTYDTEDFVEIYYEIDGGGEVLALCFNPDLECNVPGDISNEPLHHDPDCDGDGGEGTVLTNTFTEYGFSIMGTGASLNLRIRVRMDAAFEEFAFDLFEVESDTPVSSGVCPTVGAVSASVSQVCANDPFDVTATGLADMDMATNSDQDFGVEFIWSASTQADPYSLVGYYGFFGYSAFWEPLRRRNRSFLCGSHYSLC